MSLRFFSLSFIAFLIPSICFSNTCSKLFDSSNVKVISVDAKINLKNELEKILLEPAIINSVDEIRRSYDDTPEQSRMGATVQILKKLWELTDLPYQEFVTELEGIALNLGADLLMQDLTQLSPRYISTERLFKENIALVMAFLAKETAKELPPSKTENVVQISGELFKSNSEYILAKKAVFGVIDSYANQDYIPKEILSDRVEELLLAEARYQMLSAEERYVLTNRVVQSLEDFEHTGVETILEKFFYRRDKVRIK
jgi:hypothetical protein